MNFGKGEVCGVIGLESLNNVKEGGGFVLILLFGIFGLGLMVIFIGVIVLLGLGDIEVGFNMFKDNFDIIYLIVWLLVLVNVFGMILCIVLLGGIVRLIIIWFIYFVLFLFMLISFVVF